MVAHLALMGLRVILTDRACADLCASAYAPVRDAPGTWDVPIFVNQVRVLIKRYDDCDAVVFPGTDDIEQWIEDFAAIPRTTPHPLLGPVHAGFWIGVEAATQEIVKALRPGVPHIVTGHSLGAAHAWLYAGLTCQEGTTGLQRPPERIVCFGSPKPSMGTKLADALGNANIPRVSYRNATPGGYDRVTDLPYTIRPELDWQQPEFLTDVAVQPPDVSFAALRWPWHAIALYQQGAYG